MEKVERMRTRVFDLVCRLRWELGQTTAEYALVLLAAAAVAVVLIQWATGNGDLEEFFGDVVDKLRQNVTGGDSGGGG